MNNKGLKIAIVNAALEHLTRLKNEFLEEAEMKLSVNSDTEDGIVTGSLGSGDLGTEDMSKELGLMRKSEAAKVQETINQFKNYQFEFDHTEVELLSLVRTNRGTFFITSALKPLEVNDEKIHFMSQSAPIYNHFAGKKANDTFTFNGITYTINEVF